MKVLCRVVLLITLWSGPYIFSSAKGKEAKNSSEAKGKGALETESSTSDISTGAVTLEVTDVHSSGLDTINIESSGNWLEKRIWFKKGEDLFDEIRTIVKKASDIRMEFVNEVNSIGKKIDEFYEHVSFEKGQIDQMLKSILEEIDQEEVIRGGDLSSKERSLKLSVKNEQKQIESIGKDIKKIDDFDSQIDKTMMQAFKNIDECRALETKAWNDFKAIGAELDDKKARTLYYEIDNAYKNIEAKIKHLQSTLLPYLKDKLITPAEQAMTKVQNAVKSLDEKGINLEKLVKGDEKTDEQTVKEREEHKEKEAEEKWEKHQKEEMEKKEQEEQEAKKKAAEQEIEKKKKEQESHWTYRFGHAILGYMCTGLCWIWDKVQVVACHVMTWICVAGQKIAEHSPDFLNQAKDFIQCLSCKFMNVVSFVAGYVKCLICGIWAWIHRFFS